MNAAHIDEKAVFNTARRIADAEARSSYLQLACAEYPESMQRVLDLLRVHEEQQSFLESPLPGIDVLERISPLTNQLGDSIGPYKLREQLGDGGMGVVYVAEQTEPVKRKVALKIIKPGMDSRDVLARFEAERQALAMMEHPNIAKVFDAGTTDSGRPYFVMELVCGAPVTEYCDEHALTTDERLQVFLKVCRAVQHAHQKGVIHRDLKPSNVLVASIDGEAVPKVIDFGVAKAAGPKLTEQTVYTQISQLVGTPLYMSPEQVELGVADVDTRSDVYSLGVVLYELLTGNTPFASHRLKEAGFDEMRRIIREDEPPKPSARVSTLKAEALTTVSHRRRIDPRKLSDSLAGELDWLVMKALEKDRNRRYESASALAADVERFLNGEPIEAGPPSAVYRLKKFATRNKAAFTTAVLFLITILLGIAGTSWQAWRATTALATAESNRKLAEDERAKSESSFRGARKAVNRFLSKVEQDERLRNPEMQSLRGELIDIAREYYREFVNENEGNRKLQKELAEAYRRLGNIAWLVGDNELGHEAYAQAIEILKRRIKADSDNADLQHDLLLMSLDVAERPDDAQLDQLRTAIDLAKHLTTPAQRHTLAKAHLTLGQHFLGQYSAVTHRSEHLHEAIDTIDASWKIFEQLHEQHPDVGDYEMGLAEVYESLGRLANIRRDYSEAEARNKQAIAVMYRLVKTFPDNDGYRRKLGGILKASGKTREAIDVVSALADRASPDAKDQELLADAYYDIAWEDEAAARHAVTIGRELVEKYPSNIQLRAKLGTYFNALGGPLDDAGKWSDAIAARQAAIENFKQAKGYLRGDLRGAYLGLARSYEAVGQIDAAIEALTSAMEISGELQQTYPHNLNFVGHAAYQNQVLASLLRQQGDLEGSLEKSRNAVDLLAQALSDGAPNAPPVQILYAQIQLSDAYSDTGRILHQRGEIAKAADAYRRAIITERDALHERPIAIFRNCPNRNYDAWLHTSRLAGANADFESALREDLLTFQEMVQGDPSNNSFQLRVMELHLRLAEWLVVGDRQGEAAEFYAKASEILESLLRRDNTYEFSLAVAVCLYICDSEIATPSLMNGPRTQLLNLANAHLRQALDSTRELTRRNPKDGEGWRWSTWAELSFAYYQPVDWKGADEEARLAIELATGRLERLETMLPFLLLAGNNDEYQSFCRELIKTPLQQSGDALSRALGLCLLVPNPVDPDEIIKAARHAAEGSGEQHLLHIAMYRTGEFDAAIQGLMQDLESVINEPSIVQLHLAIAHHRSGHREEARSWLQKALDTKARLWESHKRTTFEVLLQEAEQLILPGTTHIEGDFSNTRTQGEVLPADPN